MINPDTLTTLTERIECYTEDWVFREIEKCELAEKYMPPRLEKFTQYFVDLVKDVMLKDPTVQEAVRRGMKSPKHQSIYNKIKMQIGTETPDYMPECWFYGGFDYRAYAGFARNFEYAWRRVLSGERVFPA